MTPGNIVVCALCLGCFASVAKAGGRQKRELRFPKGGSFVAAVALASFLPKGPTDGLAHVLEFDLGFPFPEKFSIGKKQPLKKKRKTPEVFKTQEWYKTTTKEKRRRTKRNVKEIQRKKLFLKLEDNINRFVIIPGVIWKVHRIGFNGSSCVSRLRCELSGISPDTLLEQILVTLFKPAPEPDKRVCEKHRKDCQVSLLQIIMHSKQISSSGVV